MKCASRSPHVEDVGFSRFLGEGRMESYSFAQAGLARPVLAQPSQSKADLGSGFQLWAPGPGLSTPGIFSRRTTGQKGKVRTPESRHSPLLLPLSVNPEPVALRLLLGTPPMQLEPSTLAAAAGTCCPHSHEHGERQDPTPLPRLECSSVTIARCSHKHLGASDLPASASQMLLLTQGQPSPISTSTSTTHPFSHCKT
ncbi:hypothetical protein AAY473_008326 [Plecturocebus cupreus]